MNGVFQSVAITFVHILPASNIEEEVSNITQLSILNCHVQRFAPTRTQSSIENALKRSEPYSNRIYARGGPTFIKC